ncbi:MAG: polysaccharide biosynthesis C-terminal domain-containing protein, partial [Candidatus Hydrogenedentes bacterium]|nr:polysaccharide biosynthesis C-terminal domain-containing protein [Candidatus Hydrogenedentota bacterium]
FLPGMSILAAQGKRAAATRMFNAASLTFTVTGYAGVLAMAGVQDWLVGILFPAEYASALPVLGLVLAAGVINVQAGIAGLSLVSMERPKIITAVNVVAACISLGLNAFLIPVMGIVGAGVAAVAAASFTNLAQVWFLTRIGLPISWPRYAALHLLFAAALAVTTWCEPGVVTLTIPFLYLAACFAFGILRKADLAQLIWQDRDHESEQEPHQ